MHHYRSLDSGLSSPDDFEHDDFISVGETSQSTHNIMNNKDGSLEEGERGDSHFNVLNSTISSPVSPSQRW